MYHQTDLIDIMSTAPSTSVEQQFPSVLLKPTADVNLSVSEAIVQTSWIDFSTNTTTNNADEVSIVQQQMPSDNRLSYVEFRFFISNLFFIFLLLQIS